MFCPNCGTKNDDANRFCGKCGKPLPSVPAVPAVTPQISLQPSRKYQKGLAGWRLVLVILGGFLGLCILLTGVGFATGWIHIETAATIGNSNSSPTTTFNFQQFISRKFPSGGAISPDGDYYASPIENNIELYSIPNLNLVRKITGNGSSISTVAFSPDETLLASIDADLTGKVWKVDNGELLQTFPVQGFEAFALVRFVNNDRVAFLGGSNSVFIWNISNGSIQLNFPNRSDHTSTKIFSPNGKLMADWTQFDQGAYIMDLTSGNWLPNYYADYTSTVTTGAFSSDNQLLASGSHDSEVQIWNISEQKQIASFTLDDIVKAVHFSENGNILYAMTKKGTVWIWHWKENQSLTATPPEGEYQVLQISNSGGILAVGALEGQISIVNATSGSIMQNLQVAGDQVNVSDLVFSPDNQYLIASSPYGMITIWQNMP